MEERFAGDRREVSRGQSPDGPDPALFGGPVLPRLAATGEPPPGFESALSLIAAAVTLVTIADDRDDVGVTVSAFCPVSIRPPLVLISLLEDSYPAELLGRLDWFAVTALTSGQRALAGRFSLAGRPGARLLLEDVPHHRGELSGALIPDEGLLALECETVSRVQAGDHLLVIGLAQSFLPGKESDAPLIRFNGRYPTLT